MTAASAFGGALPTAVELVTGTRIPVELVASDQSRNAEFGTWGADTLVLRIGEGAVTPLKR